MILPFFGFSLKFRLKFICSGFLKKLKKRNPTLLMSQQLFGVVVPGRHVITNFQPLTETKAVSVLEHPASITEVTFFLLPGVVLPAGAGAILYYTVDQVAWELLGSISMEKPSGVFRTNWPTNEVVKHCSHVCIGVSLES